LGEKDKHIKILSHTKLPEGNINNKQGHTNNLHDIKLAIHSCLSVANVFQQKYDEFNTAKRINEKLNESFSKINNFEQIVDCLKHLEEWINLFCKELDVKTILFRIVIVNFIMARILLS
jgi:hypothetical protein